MKATILTLSAACLACAPGAVGSTTSGGTTGGATIGVSERCVPDCDAGFLCVSGACVDLCEAIGQAHCGAECANLMSDNAHCGDCQTACKAGQGCIDGSCAS